MSSDRYSHDVDVTDPLERDPEVEEMIQQIVEFKVQPLFISFNEMLSHSRDNIKNKLNLLTEDEVRNEYNEIIGRFINPLEVH